MADILINDMKMPTRCCECRLSTCRSFKERPLCDVLVEYMSYGEWEAKRLDNCPLVPVPPHGDLVDRDEIIEAGKSHPTYKNSKIVKAVVDKACCLLKTANVVIPANKED